MAEFTSIVKKTCFYLLCFGILILFIHDYFVPYYKTVLREKIREYIIQSRLDSSGKQLQKNMVEPEKYLLIFQSIEKLFGLDNTPLKTTNDNDNDNEPSKCIFST
jgi:hypothetical protein